MTRSRVSGSGPQVVLLHGWAASGKIMEGIAAELDSEYEVHVLDLPGHGSSVEGRIDFGLDEIVRSVSSYVKQLDGPPILVGWAMGAMVSLAVAATTEIRGAVCIGTPSGGPEHGPAFEKMAGRMTKDWPRYVRSSVNAIVGDNGRVSDEMKLFLRDIMQQTSPTLAQRTILDVAVRDSTEWAADANAPILFVHGAEDKISPVSISTKLAETVAEGSVIVYEDVGHAPFLEHSEAFMSDLKTFLEKFDD